MSRKTPKRHHVKGHTRKGKKVSGYWRGSGVITKKHRYLERLKDSDVGRPEKPKHVGDTITYKGQAGHKLNGVVVGVHKKYYTVYRDGHYDKVSKGSILYRIGRAIGGAAGKIRGTIEALAEGYKTEREAVQAYVRAHRAKRLAEARRRFR